MKLIEKSRLDRSQISSGYMATFWPLTAAVTPRIESFDADPVKKNRRGGTTGTPSGKCVMDGGTLSAKDHRSEGRRTVPNPVKQGSLALRQRRSVGFVAHL